MAKQILLVQFPGEVTVGTLIYDNPCRGDIPRYNETIFQSLEKAMLMFPDLLDMVKWQIDQEHQCITSWAAIEFLNQSSRFAMANCRFIHGQQGYCNWPRCFFTCMKRITHADQL